MTVLSVVKSYFPAENESRKEEDT